MPIRRGTVFTPRGDRGQRRSLDEIATEIDRTRGGSSTVISSRTIVGSGGGESAPSPSGLVPYAGAAIQVYLYDPDDPGSPGTLIGETTTNAAGYWELDVASYCWDNDFNTPFPVTIKRDGVVIREQNVPDSYLENPGGDGFMPIMVSNYELHT